MLDVVNRSRTVATGKLSIWLRSRQTVDLAAFRRLMFAIIGSHIAPVGLG
jgi:hypothetical protein